MRVFVAGGSGVVGRRLVPQLVVRGHHMTATATGPGKLDMLEQEQLGAEAVVMDGLDGVSVGEAVATARPEVIVHQMTALGPAHAGKPDMRHMDRLFATTSRLRTEGTDHLLAAAEATGVSHVVAQGHASWNGIRQGATDDMVELVRKREFPLVGGATGNSLWVHLDDAARGFSNAKAKRKLGWTLRYPSWRQGFREESA